MEENALEVFVEELAGQLRPDIAIPFFDDEQQLTILRSILRAVFFTLGQDRAEHLPLVSAG